MKRQILWIAAGVLALMPNISSGAIFLSLDHTASSLMVGDTDTFTVFLNVNGVLPDPTVPPDSVPTPMSNFNFSVELSSVDGGAMTFTDATLAAPFAAGTTSTAGGQATFEWSGPDFSLSNQFALGTFTVQATAGGNVAVSLQERTAGNNPIPMMGPITSDFIFQTPSDPIGGDGQLFTAPGLGGLNSSGEIASLAISAVPEPASLMTVGLASLALVVRRRRS